MNPNHEALGSSGSRSEVKLEQMIFDASAMIEAVVNSTIFGLLLKRNADVLVQPVTKVEIKGRIINIEVSGYPATYKNFV